MTPANRAGRQRRGLWISVVAIIVSALPDFVSNVLANYVHPSGAFFQHDWPVVVATAGSALGGAGLVWFVYRWRTVERPPQDSGQELEAARAFPPPAVLAGQHGAVSATVAGQARRHGIVLVTGPAGAGVSAVALAAGRELAPEPDKQRYVDLRGSPRGPESPRRALIRVLRAVGIGPGTAQDPRLALASMADTLRGTEIVLVLDNAERAEQISWIADGVPGAYVIACCGDIPDRELPDGAARVQVPPLDPDAALELLARQGDDGTAVPRGRIWDRARSRLPWLFPGQPAPPVNTLAERIAADRGAAMELAASYLRLPRVAIDMGRWLAANPQVTLAALLQDLRGAEPSSELAFILRKQLDGTSAGARRLLALLARVPAAELPQPAVAALAGTGFDRTGDQLAELASRSLVEWSRPSRCRITPQARRLADPQAHQLAGQPGRKAVARSYARLAVYYARLAVAHGEALGPGGPVQEAEEWLRAEDAALLQLLRAPEPLARAAAHLWQIAGVLDTWFAREQRQEDRESAARAMAAAAKFLHDDTAGAVASLRLAALARDEGDFAAAYKNLRHAEQLLGRSTALQSQLHAEWAVYLMTAGDLEAAQNNLLDCRGGRPRHDMRGRVADLVNQAAVEIRLGRVDAAHGALSEAHALAEDAADHGGHAHAHELLGLVAWRTGQHQRASREWARALALYDQASDATGQARCLQHQGTAILSEPGGDSGEAAVLLASSLALRGDQQAGLGAALAHLYLAEAGELSAAELLAHRQAGLAALRAWPHQGSEPPEVTGARARLTALGS